jgi:hypothetical protein
MAASLAAASFAIAGCSAAPASEPASGATSPRLERAPDLQSNKHLASVVFSEDHVVRFYQTAQGDILALEEGKLGQPSVVEPVEDKSPLSLFASIAPNLQVPAELANAARDAEIARAAGGEPAPMRPASHSVGADEGGARPGATPFTTVEMAWFRANICVPNNVRYCVTAWDWANGGWNSDSTMKGRYTA